MKYKDISEEKKAIGKTYAKTFLLSYALGPIGATIGVNKYGPADRSVLKSMRRLGDDYYLKYAISVKKR